MGTTCETSLPLTGWHAPPAACEAFGGGAKRKTRSVEIHAKHRPTTFFQQLISDIYPSDLRHVRTKNSDISVECSFAIVPNRQAQLRSEFFHQRNVTLFRHMKLAGAALGCIVSCPTDSCRG